MTDTDPVVFDKKQALARMGGLEDVFRDVMTLLVTESRRIHAEIAVFYARRDPVSLRRAAHTLKGSVSLVGAKDLAGRLKRVEDCASKGDFDSAAKEFDEINRQFTQLQELVNVEMQAV